MQEFESKHAETNNGQLYIEAAAGNLAALEKLVSLHQDLVRIIALKYQSMGIAMEELQYNGNIGLIKAIHRFNGSQAGSFVSYASWWIRQSILKALREEAQLSEISDIHFNELWAVIDTFPLWEEIEGDEPNPSDLNKLLDCSIFELARLVKAKDVPPTHHLPRA